MGSGGQPRTECIAQRMVRSVMAMVRGAQGRTEKAHWLDLEALVAASCWPREVRSSSVCLNPCAEHPEGDFDPLRWPPGTSPSLTRGRCCGNGRPLLARPRRRIPLWTLGRAQIERLRDLGILWGPLTAAQEADPAFCRAITAGHEPGLHGQHGSD
jgi:hypothetical protein